MISKVAKQLVAWLPALLWALLIFHFSAGTVPSASPVLWQDFAVKKTGHVLLFGTLALLIYRGLRINNVNRKDAAIYAVILATFYGATDEFHQMFTQGRESRVRDIFIDAFGASVVMFVIYKYITKLPKEFKNFLVKLDIN